MKNHLITCLVACMFLAGCTPAQSPPEPVAAPTTGGAPSSSVNSAAVSSTPKALSAPAFELEISQLNPLPDGIHTTDDQKGRAEAALAFNGESTRIELPWNINPDVHPQLTVTAWARFTGEVASENQAQLVSHDNGSYDRGMGMDARAGQWGWSAFAGTDQVIGGAPVRQNEWTFLAVSYDQATKTTKLWVGDAEFTAQTSEMEKATSSCGLVATPAMASTSLETSLMSKFSTKF